MHAHVETSAPGPKSLPRLESSIRGIGLVNPDGSIPSSRRRVTELEREFPHVAFAILEQAPPSSVVIRQRDWQDDSAYPLRWDSEVARLTARPGWLVIIAADRIETMAPIVAQVLTRYQRLAPKRNSASEDACFERVLAMHRELHDMSKPLVRADYDHAIDVWQWVLRLCPEASRGLQLAALFHDIERLSSEADERIEQHAPDYQAFKNAHAEGGASIASRVLRRAGIDPEERARVESLIVAHEEPFAGARAPDLATLADADALSFFALNSPGFADYYGPEHTKKKVRYSLGRMSERAVRQLAGIKLRSDVGGYVAELTSGRLAWRGRPS